MVRLRFFYQQRLIVTAQQSNISANASCEYPDFSLSRLNLSPISIFLLSINSFPENDHKKISMKKDANENP